MPVLPRVLPAGSISADAGVGATAARSTSVGAPTGSALGLTGTGAAGVTAATGSGRDASAAALDAAGVETVAATAPGVDAATPIA